MKYYSKGGTAFIDVPIPESVLAKKSVELARLVSERNSMQRKIKMLQSSLKEPIKSANDEINSIVGFISNGSERVAKAVIDFYFFEQDLTGIVRCDRDTNEIIEICEMAEADKTPQEDLFSEESATPPAIEDIRAFAIEHGVKPLPETPEDTENGFEDDDKPVGGDSEEGDVEEAHADAGIEEKIPESDDERNDDEPISDSQE